MMVRYNSLPRYDHKPWRTAWQAALAACALALPGGAQGQVLFNETFAGGASTAGFTVEQVEGTCTWAYDNPGERDISGAGFDADFAIFDSDHCGSDDAAADLVSPEFDASGPGNYILSFDQQYRHVSPTVANVQVWDGTQWTVVYGLGSENAGYPNPAVSQSINITSATGGSATARLRFHFEGDNRWWWAVDNVSLQVTACAAPENLAMTTITTEGGTINWTDNGSAGYEWAVTTGALPDGSNEEAEGDGGNTEVTGLDPGAPYAVFVRADCGDGSFSPWSNGVAFTTDIINDECAGAITLTVNPDYNCAEMTPGTVAGATDSGITSTCGGTADDDVWFSFTATDTLHRISIENITGSTSDLYMALWSGDCDNLELVPGSCSDPETMDIGGLTIGTLYYLQVYSWTDTPGQTSAFDVCIGTGPTCVPPADITVGSLDVPDATVEWTSNGAMEYQWELRTEGDPGSGATGLVDDGTQADATASLSGLLPNTLYTLYVRSICTEGDTSAWSEGTHFFDGYCMAVDFTSAVEPICNVTFAGIDHDSPGDVNGSPALEDFTDQTATVARGGSYTISASGNTAGNYTTYITAFFDWDQDNVFETMVPLGSIRNSECDTAISATVDVPADAVLGTTRMRVMKLFNTAPTDPCGEYGYGQAEDYSVEVTTGTGIRDNSAAPMVLMPNPAHDRVALRNADGQATQAEIYDLVGNLVMKTARVDGINIANLAPGTYILKALNAQGGSLAHLRFVKQ